MVADPSRRGPSGRDTSGSASRGGLRARVGAAAARANAATFTNLDLNGASPVRVRPLYGEWGPAGVLSTAQKKRQRLTTGLMFVVGVAAVVLLGTYFYRAIMGF